MSHDIYLISGGVNYFLSGGANTQTVYAGSGTPWTVQTTTPYELSNNDATGNIWTPQAAPGQLILGGGPPFRDGQSLVSKAYGNVVETVGIQMLGTTDDNAAALLLQLRRILNTALSGVPCILAVKPGNTTNTAHFEILSADVQELHPLVNTVPGRTVIRAAVTWVRRPFGGRISSGETLISAVTFNNSGTGSPDNIDAFTAGAGDRINEGQPLNIKFTPSAAAYQISTIWASTIFSRTYATTGVGAYTTPDVIECGSINLSAALSRRGLKARLIVRGRLTSQPALMGFGLSYDSGGAFPIAAGPLLSVTAPIHATNNTLFDLGYADLSAIRDTVGLGTSTVYWTLTILENGGGPAGYTHVSSEKLLYYTFCKGTGTVDASTPDYLVFDSFPEATGVVALPFPTPRLTAFGSTGVPQSSWVLRGRPPVYIPGSSLWVAWLDSTTIHTTTRVASVVATHAPLYSSLRGSG